MIFPSPRRGMPLVPSISVAVRRALRVLPALLVAPAALGASPPITVEARPQLDRLDEVVVTANRAPVEITRIGSSVTVLDAQTIRESQAVITSDLLATVPGVSVVRNGGPGTLTSVRIRGATPSQTLVLVDGVAVNDPSAPGNEFDFGNTLLGDTDRIEVLRGPQSTLYGSNAIGGVINIIMARPRDGLSGNALAEYGSMSTTLLKGAVGYGSDRADARLGASWYDTDGVSTYAPGAEKDGFRNTTVSGRFGYQFTDAVGIDLRGYYSDGKANYDGFPPPNYTFGDAGDFSKTKQFVGYAGFNFALADGRFQNRLAVSSATTDRDLYSGAIGDVFPDSTYKGESLRYEYQGNWKVSDRFSAVFGAQREESEMRSDPYEPASADVYMNSFYAQLQVEIVDGLTLTAGDRYDDHETFGSEHSPQVAAAWAFGSGTILRASWGEGFKAPTLYQLFSDYRNPRLAPETSSGWDAGIEQRFLDNRASVSATYFDRDTKNQINFGFCPDPGGVICSLPGHSGFGYYENIDRVKAQGFELGAAFYVSERFDLTANYTHTQAEDRTPGSLYFGEQLLRVPEDTANATATARWPAGVSTALAVRYVSSTFDSGRVELDSYTLVDLRAAWKVSDALEVAARVENLFDEDYEQVRNYGTTGRAGYISLRYDF